jgi:DNA-binding CsgD family transcriptional regulator
MRKGHWVRRSKGHGNQDHGPSPGSRGGESATSFIDTPVAGPARLYGREREREVLRQLVARARDGQSQALVLRGEAGIGKTALLHDLVDRVPGCRVAHVAGVEAEMELPCAGLQQLCSPMLDRVGGLPAPQRDALMTALGLGTTRVVDRFLVGLGVLSLLAEVAEEQTLVCVVDDAQWLDQTSSQTLAFVARRLKAERIAMLFARRDTREESPLLGLPELAVTGLSNADARELLGWALLGPIDGHVCDSLVAESGGNPLALLELPKGMTPAALAGGFGVPGALPVGVRLEQAFGQRVSSLPSTTRQLLLVAAAEPLGDPALLWRGAELLGICPRSADAARAAGLLDIGIRVRFRHPLVRTAVYREAQDEERRAVHQALADATDPQSDPDRRAWHHACAVAGTDEAVAVELEDSARRALARGGVAAAAAFLARAMELTPASHGRGARALAAARATLDAGAPQTAYELLAVAERHPLTTIEQAKLERLRADLAFTLTRGSDAPPLLLQAARRLEPLDVALARETHLDALSAAQFAGRLAVGVGVRETAEGARCSPPPIGPARPIDLLVDGLGVRFTNGHQDAAPLLKRALRAFQSAIRTMEESVLGLFRASTTALDLWDDDAGELLTRRHAEVARQTGALAILPLALMMRIAALVLFGELGEAKSLIGEVNAVLDVTGTQQAPYGELLFAAWSGAESQADELMVSTRDQVLARGEGVGLTVIEWASALLANAAGRYEDALVMAQQAAEHPDELVVPTWALVEAVEAASRLGKIETASGALDRLCQSTQAAGSDWALGVEARSRALVTDGGEAECHYQEAIARLGRTRVRPELARAHLLYGEWLRRAGRRTEARQQLRTAHDLFTEMDLDGFAGRARRELSATGETVRKRSVDTLHDLTPQEAQIARLAAEFRTNPEIGAQLFLSPRTVEWHLRKVFTKLGISSRRELRAVLP